MSSMHTSGPWRVAFGTLVMKDNVVVADARNIFDIDLAEANARLIAVAPEILQALKLLLRDCCRIGLDLHGFGHIPDFESLDKARAAIAKAEGNE